MSSFWWKKTTIAIVSVKCQSWMKLQNIWAIIKIQSKLSYGSSILRILAIGSKWPKGLRRVSYPTQCIRKRGRWSPARCRDEACRAQAAVVVYLSEVDGLIAPETSLEAPPRSIGTGDLWSIVTQLVKPHSSAGTKINWAQKSWPAFNNLRQQHGQSLEIWTLS